MKTYKMVLFVTLLMLWFTSGLVASGDILVSFRFYEGNRSGEKIDSRVVTSYHLKPMFVGNMISATSLKSEQEELERVFNLKGLKLMTHTRWAWQEKQKDKRLQVVILNGHEFSVELELTKQADGFKVKVQETGKKGKHALLDTNISLPERKTAVFGFEDSMKKPYFLSLYREQDETVIRDEPVPLEDGIQPRVLKRVSPVYPGVAKKAYIQGNVIIEVTTDEKGKVVEQKIRRGHPLLRQAAKSAVKQWVFEPQMVKGKATPAIFTITINFSTFGHKQGILAEFKCIWPTTGYLSSMFGERIHPITKKLAFHNGIDIAAKEGKNVVAPVAGKILIAEFRPTYGNLVIIDHKNGYQTRYGQLQSITVKVGDKVKQGDLIGYVGNTGVSTAPHLHWEVRYNGKALNPMKFIEE